MSRLPILQNHIEEESADKFEDIKITLDKLINVLSFKYFPRKVLPLLNTNRTISDTKHKDIVGKSLQKNIVRLNTILENRKFGDKGNILIDTQNNIVSKIVSFVISIISNSSFMSWGLGLTAAAVTGYTGYRVATHYMTKAEIDEYVKSGASMMDVFKHMLSKREAVGYNDSYNNWAGGRDFSNMTVQEVINTQTMAMYQSERTKIYQNGVYKGRSAAYGKYQFIRSTLIDLINNKILDPNEKFTNATQDRAASYLLMDKRHFKDYIKNPDIYEDQMVKNIRNEWEGFKRMSDDEVRTWLRGMRDASLGIYKQNRNITSIQRPSSLTSIRTASGKNVVVATQYAPQFQGFLSDLESTGYKINTLSGYQVRTVAGTNRVSMHSYGGAIDINSGSNPNRSSLTTDFNPQLVHALARKWGLGWGGDWTSTKDAMHFSIASSEGGSSYIPRRIVSSRREYKGLNSPEITYNPDTRTREPLFKPSKSKEKLLSTVDTGDVNININNTHYIYEKA